MTTLIQGILDSHIRLNKVLKSVETILLSNLDNQIQQKKRRQDSSHRFRCYVSIRSNLCLKLQKVDKGDHKRRVSGSFNYYLRQHATSHKNTSKVFTSND